MRKPTIQRVLSEVQGELQALAEYVADWPERAH